MPDTRELVKLLGTRFIQRRDVKAFQASDGAWAPVRSPLTMRDFEAHLAGSVTMGHYMLDTEDNCKLFAFDLDLVKQEMPLQLSDERTVTCVPRDSWVKGHEAAPYLTAGLKAMGMGLAHRIEKMLGLPVAVAYTGGKGLHVYGFTGTIPGDAARALALKVLDATGAFEPYRGESFFRHKFAFPFLSLEVFPKQGSLAGKDLGNLMALPLGRHQVTKRPKFFVSEAGDLTTLQLMAPEHALGGVQPWEV